MKDLDDCYWVLASHTCPAGDCITEHTLPHDSVEHEQGSAAQAVWLERPGVLACRSIQLLTALAAALAEALPGAAAVLRQNLASVLDAKQQAVPNIQAAAIQGRQHTTTGQQHTATGEWDPGSSCSAGQTRKQAAALTVDMEAANNAAVGAGHGSHSDDDACSDSDSAANSADSISALAGASDTELEPFLDLNFCARQMQLHAGCSPADSPPAATPPGTPSPLTTPSPPAKAQGRLVEQATEALAGVQPSSPQFSADISGGTSGHGVGGGDVGEGQGHSDEDIAALKAALHGQPAAPAAEQLAQHANGAAYLRWHAASSYNVSSSSP